MATWDCQHTSADAPMTPAKRYHTWVIELDAPATLELVTAACAVLAERGARANGQLQVFGSRVVVTSQEEL